MGYQMDPPFIFFDYYKEHFDVFRKNKINSFFNNNNDNNNNNNNKYNIFNILL